MSKQVRLPAARDARPIPPWLASASVRDRVVLAVLIVAVARLAPSTLAWLVAGLALAYGLVAGPPSSGGAGRRGSGVRALGRRMASSGIVPMIVPAVAIAGAVGAIRLVPLDLSLLAALALLGLGLAWLIAAEEDLAPPVTTPADDDATVLARVVGVAFLAFAGVAAIVPGGLAEPVPPGAPETIGSIPEGALLALVAADAAVGALLGYRLARRGLSGGTAAIWSAVTYGVVIATGAGALRALAIPRLLGPALLTVLFFLWDAFHDSGPARHRTSRWAWELALLGGLALVVIALNLELRA